MKPKVVIIGAGSASFGLGTLATLLKSPLLRGGELALVDVNVDGLTQVNRLACRLNREWDAGVTIHSSTDRRQVLPGADFCIVSIEVGPREGLWQRDWEIPLQFGVRQPYGENGGPGGLAHTLRQVPALLAIARDMEQLCPQCWLISFANPLPRLCLAVSLYSRIRMVGLCHQFNIAYFLVGAALSEQLGLEVPLGVNSNADPNVWPKANAIAEQVARRIEVQAAGLNHFTWILDVRDRSTGVDLYPTFRQALHDMPTSFEPLTRAVLDLTGICPVPGDSHLSEYLPWCHDPLTRPWEKYNLYLYDWEHAKVRRNRQWQDITAMAHGDAPVDHLLQANSEGAIEIIGGLWGGTEVYRPAVNVPNHGYIPNLPEGTIVEVPAVVDGGGIHGVHVGPLPDAVAELCRREAVVARLAVDAAVTGRRDLLLQALAFDPCINDLDIARSILDAYLVEYATYLPAFKAG